MKIEDFDEPIVVGIPGMFFLSCCDCELRHVIMVDRKGKDKVQLGFIRDDEFTSMARAEKKRKKIK